MIGRASRALVVLLAAGCSACADAEVVTASYASRVEARNEGAIVPAWMPESAEDIREAHGPDSKQRWGLFNFAPADGERIRAALRPGEFPLDGIRCDIPGRIEWWPVLLRGSLDSAQIKAAALEAYRTNDDNLILIVNWKQGRAYYWSL